MTETAQRWALITGATAGIGEATAIRLASAGWSLLVWGRRTERLKALAARLQDNQTIQVHCQTVDVRDAAAVQQAVAELPEGLVPEVLVNNAGLARGLDTVDAGLLSDWDEMIDTNLKGLLYVTRAVLPLMRAKSKGHVVNIGSTAAKEVYPKGNVYCATKHAVDALTRAMRLDLNGTGIRVTAVHPGMVETEFSQVRFHGDTDRARQVYQGFRPLRAEDVAEVVAWVVAQPPHVTIADVVLMSTDQASSTVVHRSA